MIPWDLHIVQKGGRRSTREAGSLWPMGEGIQLSVTHPSSTGQWGFVTTMQSLEEKALSLCVVARRQGGVWGIICAAWLSRGGGWGGGGESALTGTEIWRTILLRMDMSQPLGLLLWGSHLLVKSGCSFFQILVLFQLRHTETIFFLF